MRNRRTFGKFPMVGWWSDDRNYSNAKVIYLGDSNNNPELLEIKPCHQ